MSVDSYRPGWMSRRVFKTLVVPGQLPPRAICTVLKATQAGRFTVQGPSATGPFTVIDARGEYWGRGPWVGVGSLGASGHNHGVT
jgi:hypothetical protein